MENLDSGTAELEVDEAVVNVTQLAVPARVDRLPIVRGLVENVLLTDDFSLDTVADLKVGVDESCTELIALAHDSAVLTVVVATGPHDVRVAVSCAVGDSTVDQTGFGWYVIDCVADDVSVEYYDDGARGREATITLTTLRD